MTRLRLILLVDDSEMDNYIHLRRLNKMGLAEEVVVCTDGKKALDYLTTAVTDGGYPRPDIIFLDINMPVMDGWEFLDAYGLLPNNQRAAVVAVMLTSVAGTVDAERAFTYSTINVFETKPLEKKNIGKLMQRFFPGVSLD